MCGVPVSTPVAQLDGSVGKEESGNSEKGIKINFIWG